MIEFPFHVPIDPRDDLAESTKVQNRHDEEVKYTGDLPPIVYETFYVEEKKLNLLTHDSQLLEFTYYGMLRDLEGDPHGPGVAICNFNR